MAKEKTISLKQMKKRILRLKNSMVKNLSTITNTVSKMITNVNSVLNTLTDEDYLRNVSIGIEPDGLSSGQYYDSAAQKKIFAAYKNIPEDFFDMGGSYAESFGEGFLNGISGLADSVKSSLVTGYYADSAGKSTENITYNTSYNFYSSNQTVAEQLQQARREEQLKQLRA